MNEPAPDIVEDLHMLRPGEPWWWVGPLVISVAVLAVAVFLIVRLYRRKQLPFVNAPIPPQKTAKDRLSAIRYLIVEGMHREFVNEVSKILRYYIEERFDLKAPHLSTEEFLYEAERNEVLRSEFRESLAAFLFKCDKVKFALGDLAEPAMESLFQSALDFIERTNARNTEVAA